LRLQLLALIDEAVTTGARLRPACALLGLTPRTLQRWRRAPFLQDGRKGPTTPPAHKLTLQEKERIVRLANEPDCRNLSAEQVIAKLADKGIYVCSERSLRRILKERKLDRYRERAKPASPQHKPRQYVARRPLRVLSWDITFMRNSQVHGSYFFLYLFLDIWSRRIVGWQVYEEQSAERAAQLLRQLCRTHGIEANCCTLHADNGGPMKGATMLATLQALGVQASFSRPGVSDDNPYVESLFGHLKYAPSYPRQGFAGLEQARAWVTRFVDWYNHQHLHSAIAYVTPHDRHHGRDIEILARRRQLYLQARSHNPRRWTKEPRSWQRPTVETLNPDRVVTTAPAVHHLAA
jgi:putative transposase